MHLLSSNNRLFSWMIGAVIGTAISCFAIYFDFQNRIGTTPIVDIHTFNLIFFIIWLIFALFGFAIGDIKSTSC